METAGYLVAAAAEFTACVEYGINDCCSRYALLRVYTYGDASSVIGNADYIALKYLYGYLGTVACKGFVYGVVHNLVNEVVESAGTCGTDVHTRSFADCLQSFEDLYVVFIVVVVLLTHDLPPMILVVYVINPVCGIIVDVTANFEKFLFTADYVVVK